MCKINGTSARGFFTVNLKISIALSQTTSQGFYKVLGNLFHMFSFGDQLLDEIVHLSFLLLNSVLTTTQHAN